MPTYQRAKENLGARLRELRRNAGLNGRQLAQAAGWQASKVSKIESGKQRPSEEDVQTWAHLCDRAEETSALVASLRSLEEMYVEFRRMFRAGLGARQRSLAEIEQATTLTRNFEVCFIPGLLQTAEYARYRLAEGDEGDDNRGAPRSEEELEDAVTARIERQRALRQPDRHHHFVITEAALRYLVCPPDVMAGQLGQLVTLTTMQRIRVGIIPFGTPLPIGPLHGFYIYDDHSVQVELFTATLRIVDPDEIRSYRRVFDQLADTAVYGAEARTLISRAIADLGA